MIVPNSFLSPTFEHSRGLVAVGFGAELRWNRDEQEWFIGLGGASFLTADSTWQIRNTNPETASWTEFDLDLAGIWVGGEWGLRIHGPLSLRYGGSVGLAMLMGNVYATEMVPGCEAPATTCGHWKSVTRHPVEFSSRITPILDLHLGLRLNLGERFLTQLEIGVKDMPFVGLSFGWDMDAGALRDPARSTMALPGTGMDSAGPLQ